MNGETKNTPGFCWHVHHNVLVEWCYNYKGRVDYIQCNKPVEEVPLRLKLFKRVKGKLPSEVGQARRACVQAWQACVQARRAYDQAWEACDQTERACVQAWQACVQAIEEHMLEIEALHVQECPNCPWNGETIFPSGDVK